MRWQACIGVVFLLFLITPAGSAAAGGAGDATLRFGPPPAWVDQLETPGITPTADDETRGYAYALMDRQIHRGTAERHVRLVYAVTSSGGVQEMSTVRVGWNPAFETATVHYVRRTRGGVTEDLARPERFQTLRREQNLSFQMVDGRLSAVAHLEDVRVGDRLDISYTVRGLNPVFGGKYGDAEALEFSAPVQLVRVRVVRPGKAFFAHRLHGSAKPEHRVGRTAAGLIDESWTSRNVAEVPGESEAPNWVEPRSYVQFSEYRDWQEVIAWGTALFRSDGPLPAELESRAAEIEAAATDPEERVARVARLAQEELRYLSLSIGENSHRPAPPAESYRRRFGDCKDKAVLLSSLLRRLGIDAAPALVDSSGGRLLPDKLPSAGVFDHCIVRLRHAGNTYWIDATRTHQGTGLATRFVTNFARALVLTAEESGLTEVIRTKESQGRVEVTDRIDCRDPNKPAQMASEYVYTGLEAERVRDYFTTTSRADISRRTLESRRRSFGPTVSEAAPWEMKDDLRANRLVIREWHRLPSFWTVDTAGGKTANLKPSALIQRVSKPEMVERRTPFAIRLPDLVRHRIEAQLPDIRWTPSKDRNNVAGPGFEFAMECDLRAPRFVCDFTWRTTARVLLPDQMTEYARKVAAVEDALGQTLTVPAPPVVKPFRMNWTLLGVVVATAFLAWRWFLKMARRPPSAKEREQIASRSAAPLLTGLSGWMVLVGLRVFLAPLMLARELWQEGKVLFDVTLTENYRRGAEAGGWFVVAEPLLFAGMALMAALFAVKLVLPVMFLRWNFRFPRWMALTLAAEMCIALTLSQFDPTGAPRTGLVVVSLALAAYLLTSKRARSTFTWIGNENLVKPPLPTELPPELPAFEPTAELVGEQRSGAGY